MRVSYLDLPEDEEEIGETKEDIAFKEKFKLIVIGDRKVGKTSLINRIHKNEFSILYQPTNHIQICSNVKVGDINMDIWDIPPNMCKYYKVTALQSDAIILMFDSDRKETLTNGIDLWKRLYEKLYTKYTPELWFVYRGHEIDPIEECHPDRLFKIDNMSRDGLLDLIFDIRCKLIKKY